nr:MAG TPA: hypothetical protein [Caudoviricetes sp.]
MNLILTDLLALLIFLLLAISLTTYLGSRSSFPVCSRSSFPVCSRSSFLTCSLVRRLVCTSRICSFPGRSRTLLVPGFAVLGIFCRGLFDDESLVCSYRQKVGALTVLLFLRCVSIESHGAYLCKDALEIDEISKCHDVLHPEQEATIGKHCAVILKVQEFCHLAVHFYISFHIL